MNVNIKDIQKITFDLHAKTRTPKVVRCTVDWFFPPSSANMNTVGEGQTMYEALYETLQKAGAEIAEIVEGRKESVKVVQDYIKENRNQGEIWDTDPNPEEKHELVSAFTAGQIAGQSVVEPQVEGLARSMGESAAV